MLPDLLLCFPVHQVPFLDWAPECDFSKVFAFGELGADVDVLGSVARHAVGYYFAFGGGGGGGEASFDCVGSIVDYEGFGGGNCAR